jgi:hypothetical protein
MIGWHYRVIQHTDYAKYLRILMFNFFLSNIYSFVEKFLSAFIKFFESEQDAKVNRLKQLLAY